MEMNATIMKQFRRFCKSVIRNGSCNKQKILSCHDCQKYVIGGECDKMNIVNIAQDYIKKHKGEKIKPREK